MQLTDEQIIKIAKDKSERFEPLDDGCWFSFFEAEAIAFARKILLEVQPNSDLLPQLNKHEVSGRSEQLPLDFTVWYSGMDKSKVLKAYERYKVESGNCH